MHSQAERSTIAIIGGVALTGLFAFLTTLLMPRGPCDGGAALAS